MRRLTYTSAAVDDLADIATFIFLASGSVEQAEKFASELRQKCQDLATLPGTLGRPRNELRQNLRSFAYRGHVIFFQYRPESIQIINVLSARRDIDSHFVDQDFE